MHYIQYNVVIFNQAAQLHCRHVLYTIQSNPIQSNPIQSNPILSYPMQSSPLLSSPHLSYPILSYPILSYPILSYPILSYPILSYPILSSPLLSYRNAPLNHHDPECRFPCLVWGALQYSEQRECMRNFVYLLAQYNNCQIDAFWVM